MLIWEIVFIIIILLLLHYHLGILKDNSIVIGFINSVVPAVIISKIMIGQQKMPTDLFSSKLPVAFQVKMMRVAFVKNKL